MSRFKKISTLIAPLTFLLLLGTAPPVQADGAPPPPTPHDVCGTAQDQFYAPNGQSPLDYVSWTDSLGNHYGAGYWYSTAGASSITLTATVNGGTTQYTYPPMTFGTEADSTCTQAPDTVTTRIVGCNASNGGTVVEFTYTNTADSTGWWHTRPRLYADRWDHAQTANIVWTEGNAVDGAQLSVTGGDQMDFYANHFFLVPGTYNMTLTTNETGDKVLPNRLFVPACGTRTVPKGDPMGGPTPIPAPRPRATISRCRAHTVRVGLDARAMTTATRYKVTMKRAGGRTVVRYYTVTAQTLKRLILRHQHSRTVIKIIAGTTLSKRRLTC